MRKLLNANSICLVAALLTIVFLQLGSLADDPGLGWHLLTGEFVSSTNTIPKHDPFLYSVTPREWICDQWLSDLILNWIFNIGSWPLLYVMAIILFLSIYFAILSWTLKGRAIISSAVAISAFLCFKLGLVHFVLRPVLFGIFLFVITFSVILKLYWTIKSDTERVKIRAEIVRLTYCLPLLFFIWANMHPSFVLGFFLIGLLIAALIMEKFFRGLKYPSDFSDRLVLLLLLCALATVFNPNFTELHRSIGTLAQSEYFMNLNSEWKSLNFKAAHAIFFEIILVFLALAIFINPKRFSSWGWFELLLLISFTHFALQSERMLVYFSIVAMPFLAEALTALFEKGKSQARFQYSSSASSIVFVLLLGCAVIGKIPGYSAELGPNKENYPSAALDFLMAAPGDNKIIYSTPNWGGFIALHGKGALKAVIDDRNTLLGEGPYRDYFKVINGDPGWRDIVKSSGANYLLLESDKPLVNQLELTQQPTFKDKHSVIFALGQ